MKNNYTDLQLKLWLAKQLPEEIETYTGNLSQDTWLVWKDGHGAVTPREWDYIVRRAEEKLTGEQLADYIYKFRGCGGSESLADVLMHSWQSRAIALSQTLNIPILIK